MKLLAVPDRRGLDRLDDLADADPPQPVIFAANHHSHVDTPLLLSSIPEPWRPSHVRRRRRRLLLHVAGAVGGVGAGAQRHPDRAHPRLAPPGRRRRRAHRRRVEPGDLPGGRPLTRRLGPAVPRRRRLPRAPLQGARWCPCTSRAPVASCARASAARRARRPGSPSASRCGRPRARTRDGSRSASSGPSRRWPTRSRSDWYSARVRAHRAETPSLSGPEAASWRRAWALGDRGPKRRRSQERRWPDVGPR